MSLTNYKSDHVRLAGKGFSTEELRQTIKRWFCNKLSEYLSDIEINELLEEGFFTSTYFPNDDITSDDEDPTDDNAGIIVSQDYIMEAPNLDYDSENSEFNDRNGEELERSLLAHADYRRRRGVEIDFAIRVGRLLKR